MVESGIFPACSGVARSAISSETAVVVIILCMACETIRRSAFKDAVHMALSAIHIEMRAVQLE